MEFILTSLQAFNMNAASRIAYSFTTNWWLIFFVGAIVLCTVLGVKEETQTAFHEEQNIL